MTLTCSAPMEVMTSSLICLIMLSIDKTSNYAMYNVQPLFSYVIE